MRLIDADALAKAFREASETDDSKDNRTYWSESLISAAEEVDDAPTIDAVEVVRCKDCKHYIFDGDRWLCKLLSNNYEPIVDLDDDGFCSRGERRSE